MPRFENVGTTYIEDFKYSQVRPIREQRVKYINNISSMMGRFKDYTENMGRLRKSSLGVTSHYIMSPINDFCDSIEDFIKYTLRDNPYKDVIDEINSYLLDKIDYQIDLTNIFKSYNLPIVQKIIPLADDFIDKIYKGKNLKQSNKFAKSAMIINVMYAMLLADYVLNIRKNIRENPKEFSYLWRDTYEIGFLQGEMCLIESHLDKEIIDIHRRSKSSQEKTDAWKVRHKELEEKDKELDNLLKEPLKYAEDQWKTSKKITYHNKMADDINKQKKYASLGIDRSILIDKLRPIAKKYRYADFCEGEFKTQLAITVLCKAINNDRYHLQLKSHDNTIDRLNEIIKTPDFYSKWFKRKPEINLSPELDELIGDTHGCRKKEFSVLTEVEQRKIKRLNRLLLEYSYPSSTPKSLKYGLMRGHD